jgi:hypothetical protein
MSNVAEAEPVSEPSFSMPISALAWKTISRRSAIRIAERRICLYVSGKFLATSTSSSREIM